MARPASRRCDHANGRPAPTRYRPGQHVAAAATHSARTPPPPPSTSPFTWRSLVARLAAHPPGHRVTQYGEREQHAEQDRERRGRQVAGRWMPRGRPRCRRRGRGPRRRRRRARWRGAPRAEPCAGTAPPPAGEPSARSPRRAGPARAADLLDPRARRRSGAANDDRQVERADPAATGAQRIREGAAAAGRAGIRARHNPLPAWFFLLAWVRGRGLVPATAGNARDRQACDHEQGGPRQSVQAVVSHPVPVV